MNKRFVRCWIMLVGICFSVQTKAQAPVWIWYPGDFDVWMANKMQNRRTERGTFFPPFWRLDNHYVLMDFHKVFELKVPERVQLFVEGQYNVKLDGKMLTGYPGEIMIPAGKHQLNIKVHAQDVVPSILVKGETVFSDTSWLVTFEDKEWIDETGKASDQSGTTWLNAGTWGFKDPLQKPSAYKLATKPMFAAATSKNGNGTLTDFGKETFGFLKLHGLKGDGLLNVYYGESKEEALSATHCETLDMLKISQLSARDSVLPLSKAFRYVNIVAEGNVRVDSVSMLYEYLPLQYRGAFNCSDPQLNKIWDVSAYTLHLSSREFFIDGIKRDRWIWSGDAYQSYLMNYYLFFDAPAVSRTALALRGKDPVSSHINTIMDYTFYWFLGVYDYYLFTGDQSFIKQFYPRMKSLMDFCLARRNKNGFMEGLAGDWVFIDWAEKLSKQGEVSFEQLLLCRSLETMSLCAGLYGDEPASKTYQALFEEMKKKIAAVYWNEQKKALVHSRVNGMPTENVTRYANMFSIFFGYFTNEQQNAVKHSVLLNPAIQKITTPYMRFYELEALCAMGEQSRVLQEMKAYWGGMLELGATSFWEEYNPDKKGAEHYAMYGRPFGKSLCHAWGASPIYLLGKYYLGVKPTAPGYEKYLVEPVLGGLEWMEGKVPTPDGDVAVRCSRTELKITGALAGTGTLRFRSKTKPVVKDAQVSDRGNGVYEVTIEPGKAYVVKYRAVQ